MSLAIVRGKILIMWERSLYDEFFETAGECDKKSVN